MQICTRTMGLKGVTLSKLPVLCERSSILLYNPVPRTYGRGGPIAFAGCGAAENKGIAFGGFCHSIVTL